MLAFELISVFYLVQIFWIIIFNESKGQLQHLSKTCADCMDYMLKQREKKKQLYFWHLKNKKPKCKNAKRSLRLLFVFTLARTHFALPASGIIQQDSSIYSWHGDIIWEFWRELRDHLLLCLNVWWEIQFYGEGSVKKKALSTYHMLLLGLASLWVQFQLCIFQENIITHNLTCLCKVDSFVTHPKFCIQVLRLKDRRDVCALPGAVIPPASPLWANVAPQESCGEITAEPQWDMSYGALNERAVPHWAL